MIFRLCNYLRKYKKVFKSVFCFCFCFAFFLFFFLDQKVTPWNIKRILGFPFPEIYEIFSGFLFPETKEIFSGRIFFIFGTWKVTSWNIRNYKRFFNIRAWKFHFPEYKKLFSGQIFFVFWVWAKKCVR